MKGFDEKKLFANLLLIRGESKMANSTLRFKLINGKMQECKTNIVESYENHIVKLSENSSKFKGFVFQQLDKVRDGLDIVEGKVNKVFRSWGFAPTMSFTFFEPFMQHIFPLMLDVAKVYCIIMICKDFYSERRGGRGDDGAGGFSSIIKYGKWYILFALTPYFVQLIGGIGENMYHNLMHDSPATPTINGTVPPTSNP
jgi:hypothetical protein